VSEPRSRSLRTRLGGEARRLLSRHPGAYRLARRALVLTRLAARRPHDEDFAAFALFRDRRGLFLDVGANVGQSALSFRLFHDASILSIEPNPENAPDLRLVKRLIRRFDYLLVAAGEETGSATLHIPTYRGSTVTGEATLVSGSSAGSYWAGRHLGAGSGSDMGVVDRDVEVRRLDDLGLEPSFVKLDVEGFELSALRGLQNTLTRCHPIVMVERSAGFPEVRELLGSLGYAPFTFEPSSRSMVAYTGRSVNNVFFLPEG
jgi:FkbM family methyltransferase